MFWGYLFFDFRNTTIRKGIIEPYCQCNYTKKCMSPNSSSRKNHRQDQAMLSVLIRNLNLHYSANKSILFSAKFHKESLSLTIKFLRKKYLYQIKNQVGSFYLPSFLNLYYFFVITILLVLKLWSLILLISFLNRLLLVNESQYISFELYCTVHYNLLTSK